MKRSALCLAACLFAVACGGPGNFNGKVGTYSLNVKEAISVGISPNGSDGGTMAAIWMADQTGLCDDLKNNVNPKGITSLTLAAGTVDANGNLTAVAPGTFNIATNGPAGVSQSWSGGGFEKLDASCNSVFPVPANNATPVNMATSGKVVISSIKLAAGGGTAGTFDLTFGSGDHATGSFNATYCDVTFNSNNTPPTCK